MKALFNSVNLKILIILVQAMVLANCNSMETFDSLPKPGTVGGILSSEGTSSSSGGSSSNFELSSSSSEEALSSSSGSSSSFEQSSSSSEEALSSSSGSSSSFELSSSSSESLKECEGTFNPNNRFCYDGEIYDRCDGMEYNPTTQICQGGVAVIARCGGTQYNPLKQRCCASAIYSLENQRCQSNVVETKCGTGNIYHNPTTEQCCVNAKYTTSTEFCQGTTVKPLCGTATYTVSQFCQSGTNVVKDLCGTQTYTASQFCCNAEIGTTSTEFCQGTVIKPLCGDQTFNATEFCQGTTVKPLCGDQEYTSAEQCCVNTKYTISTQFCQGGTTVKPLCGGQTFTATEFCQGTVIKPLCGGQTFTATEFCYNNTSVYSKCNDNEYNPSTHFCHSNQLYSCGNLPYDPSIQFCQGGSTIKPLCDGQTFSATEFCQGTTIKSLCGTATYTASQFCQTGTNAVKDLCGNQIYTSSQFCCNTAIGTTSTEFCQGTTVKPLCGTATYTSSQFCQGGTTVKPLCGTATYTSSQFCQTGTNAVKDLCGTQTYTASQFCYNNSKIVNFCGTRTDTYNPDIYQCKSDINANGIYLKTPVSYQGESYEAVLIGEQTWLAKNLNYNAPNSRCFYDIPARCGTYGRLYYWATAMAGAASSNANPSGVQGICPSGWHLPSQAEWDALNTFIQSNKSCSDCGAKHLKSVDGWYYGSNGEDSYGFAALPGGFGFFDGDDYDSSGAGYSGHWWSASGYSSGYLMVGERESTGWTGGDNTLKSVRCLQD